MNSPSRRRFLLALPFLFGCSSPPKRKVHSEKISGVIRVACVGDSITYGAGVENRAMNCYPEVLSGLLGGAYEVHNFGVSGATLLKSGDHPWWNTPAFTEATVLRPHVVVIALGTNDSKPQNWRHGAAFTRDAHALVRHFQGLPTLPHVYLCLPPPVFEERWGINEPTLRDHIRPQLRDVARLYGTGLVNLDRALADSPEELPDGIHPDAAGAAVIAQTVHSALLGR